MNVCVVATAGVSCGGGDGAQGCGIPGEAGEWSGCCLCISTEQHSHDSIKDLNSVSVTVNRVYVCNYCMLLLFFNVDLLQINTFVKNT